MCKIHRIRKVKYHAGLCSPFIHSVYNTIILLADSESPNQTVDAQVDLVLHCMRIPEDMLSGASVFYMYTGKSWLYR